MELGSQDEASAQPTLVLHLLIDYISHFTFLVFLQEPAQTISVFLAKIMSLEPSAYSWLPAQNKKGRNTTNVWLSHNNILLLQGRHYAQHLTPPPSELKRVELGAKEYILIKYFDGTNPTDLVKQVKCNCSLPCFHVTCHCVLLE